ncbi:hypothetical protein PABG_07619 [Paracoccidioides brasiliensis Pb03]|nr:hypothetical protein PABG_07619 [Paracoccidioides brasiliensis Pb03]
MVSPVLSLRRKISNTGHSVVPSLFAPLISSPRPLSPKRIRPHGPDVDVEQMNPLDGAGERNGEDDNEQESHEHEHEHEENEEGNSHHSGSDEDEHDGLEASPLLPIFSASHLDSLPTYPLAHAIRVLITSRIETTLSWDQLRSPQVSQFLLKSIQQQIRQSHFSRATLYALMANCLQFKKEVNSSPGNSGTSNTRAMVCELLAIKLLKEYSTRELIDALSYDFYPLQEKPPPMPSSTLRTLQPSSRDNTHKSKFAPPPKAGRISCLEIAIRAQAKRFLAHPLVVQQLEAIWAGNIVFHFEADSLHRLPPPPPPRINTRSGYGSFMQTKHNVSNRNAATPRRSVTLYNPRGASLFKLSRLRVPLYRQVLSTLSFAILLGLFLAVIQRRSLKITTLELIFWLWSAGFMLDELVGFNEQGFSLYLMSFWNTFDVGILLLLFCYYCLRIYGVVAPDNRKKIIANHAYDVLAANAVLLLPRLFSVLDHYRYFSQLLIAFRMMAADLVAVFTLIIIACSGFFVAFTFSFGNGDSPGTVVYALFQMLMGFTPAAWQLWDKYNLLGKTILTLFLFICHFLVVTILITVLTNSFMAIVQNANEEHQFVFAVNTLSMVKSGALFSYVAPTNLLEWIITPLRFIMPFPKYIKLNRTVIKITHMPILFMIYLYERTILRPNVFEPSDLINRGDARQWNPDHHNTFDAFTRRNSIRVREPSIATYQKDRALDEVFRYPAEHASYRGPQRRRSPCEREASKVVDTWMQNLEPESGILSPDAEDMNLVERLGKQRFWRHRVRRYPDSVNVAVRNLTETTCQSIASDPEDWGYSTVHRRRLPRVLRSLPVPQNVRQSSQQTDMEDGEELTSTCNEQGDSVGAGRTSMHVSDTNDQGAQSSTPSSLRGLISSRKNSPSRRPKTPQRHHFRNASGATILYKPRQPQTDDQSDTDISQDGKIKPSSIHFGGGPNAPKRRSPKGHDDCSTQTAPRAIKPPKPNFMPVSDTADLAWPSSDLHKMHGRSSLDMGLGSDLGDNKAVGGGFVGGIPSGISFATQMAYATGSLRRPAVAPGSDNQDMMSKLVLARMRALEDGFRDVIREVRELRRAEEARDRRRDEEELGLVRVRERQREREWEREQTRGRERERDRKKRKAVRSQGAPRSRDDTEVGFDSDGVGARDVAGRPDVESRGDPAVFRGDVLLMILYLLSAISGLRKEVDFLGVLDGFSAAVADGVREYGVAGGIIIQQPAIRPVLQPHPVNAYRYSV